MDFEIILRRGSLALIAPALLADMAHRGDAFVPEAARAERHARDGADLHVTLALKAEVLAAGDAPAVLERARVQLLGSEFADLGVGRASAGSSTAWYKALFFPAAFQLRRALGCMGAHDFHLTCGFRGADVHGVDKSAHSLVAPDPDAPARVLAVAAAHVRRRALELRASRSPMPADECAYVVDALDAAFQSVEAQRNSSAEARRMQVLLLCERARVLLCAARTPESAETAHRAVELCHSLLVPHAVASVLNQADASAHFGGALVASHARCAAAFAMETSLRGACRQHCVAGLEAHAAHRSPHTLAADVDLLQSVLRRLDQNAADSVAGAAFTSASNAVSASDANAAASADAAASSSSSQSHHGFTDPRARVALGGVAMPRNFSWLVPRALCGMSLPTRADQIGALYHAAGVRCIVTAMDEPEAAPLPLHLLADVAETTTQCTYSFPAALGSSHMSAIASSSAAAKDNRDADADRATSVAAADALLARTPASHMLGVHLPVANYAAPSVGGVDFALRIVEACVRRGAAAAMHCGGGKGRCGTLLCCYAIKHGLGSVGGGVDGDEPGSRLARDGEAPRMSAADAMRAVRAMRPGSVETEAQEAFIAHYGQVLWRRSSANLNDALPRAVVAPTFALISAPTSAPVKLKYRLFVLCGLPGSGKSTFAELLMTLNQPGGGSGDTWVRVSQDELGHRSACEALVAKHTRGSHAHSHAQRPCTRLVIDRCNVEAADRAHWAQLARFKADACVCVYFATGAADECTRRVVARGAHPTLGHVDARKAAAVVARCADSTGGWMVEGSAIIISNAVGVYSKEMQQLWVICI
jgi:hypothetical protein